MTSPTEYVKIVDYFTKDKLEIDITGDFYQQQIICGKTYRTVFTEKIEFIVFQSRKIYEISFFAVSIASKTSMPFKISHKKYTNFFFFNIRNRYS